MTVKQVTATFCDAPNCVAVTIGSPTEAAKVGYAIVTRERSGIVRTDHFCPSHVPEFLK